MRAKGVFAGSEVTAAEPISPRLTWTPSSCFRAFSTRATQCPQLMPSILMLRCSMASSPLHCLEQYTPPPYFVATLEEGKNPVSRGGEGGSTMPENPGMIMKRLLPLALASLLLPAAGWAQDSQPPPSTDAKPAEAQPAQEPEKKPPEKKPDAFQYFFGKKRDEKKKAPEAPKAPEVIPEKPMPPAEPAPVSQPPAPPAAPAAPEPAPALEVRPEPPAVAQPQVAPPVLAPAPAAEEPKVDAFQYFFGHAAQPLPEPRRPEGAKVPLTAFDYFFGKNGRADVVEPKSPPR